jgi:hypothetical protein
VAKFSIGQGSEFASLYRTLLWSVDLLEGDNPLSNSITDHGMVDADACKLQIPPPLIYNDKQAGMSNVELEKKHSLLGLPSKLLHLLRQSDADPQRHDVLRREITVADLRNRYTLSSDYPQIKKPTFEDLWIGVTGRTPPTLKSLQGEIVALKQTLTVLLAQAGYTATSPQNLQGCLHRWEANQLLYGIDDAEEINVLLKDEVMKHVAEFKALAFRVPELAPFAEQIRTDGYSLKVLPDMNFDAGLSYVANGEAQFEWNAGRPAPEVDIRYIARHEATHWLNAYLMDLRRQAGLLGPEAALLTMSSPRAMNEEGLAQVMLEMLCGGSLQGVVQQHSVDMAITIVLDQLQDIARLAAAIGWNQDFANLPEENRRLTICEFIGDDLLQTSHIKNKYAGPKKKFWRMLPGGITYAPAYYYGSRAYRHALQNHSVEEVLAVGCHARGLVDLQAFNELLSELLA